MNYCSRCGQKLPQDDSRKCSNCGLAITTSTAQKSKKERPQGVAIISVLSIISGIIVTALGLFIIWMFSSLIGSVPNQFQYLSTFVMVFNAIGFGMFIVGLFSLLIGWGLWKGKGWAWTLAAILGILGIIGGIIAIPFSSINEMFFAYSLISLLVYGLILYYLFKPNVKAWFKKKLDTKPASEDTQLASIDRS